MRRPRPVSHRSRPRARGAGGAGGRLEAGRALAPVHAELAGSPEALARFEREVEVLRRIQSPGLVEILDVRRPGERRPRFADPVRFHPVRPDPASPDPVRSVPADSNLPRSVRPVPRVPRDPVAELEALVSVRADRHPSVTVTVEARRGEAAFHRKHSGRRSTSGLRP